MQRHIVESRANAVLMQTIENLITSLMAADEEREEMVIRICSGRYRGEREAMPIPQRPQR